MTNDTLDTEQTFTRVRPHCPEDGCGALLAVGQPEYHGDPREVLRADVWCTEADCGFRAEGVVALVDLVVHDGDDSDREPISLVIEGAVESTEVRY